VRLSEETGVKGIFRGVFHYGNLRFGLRLVFFLDVSGFRADGGGGYCTSNKFIEDDSRCGGGQCKRGVLELAEDSRMD